MIKLKKNDKFKKSYKVKPRQKEKGNRVKIAYTKISINGKWFQWYEITNQIEEKNPI